MYVACVIPTIDEADTIGELVRALVKICDWVMVVDGSQDERTHRAAEEAGAQLCREGRGLGPSYAAVAWKIPNDWAVVHIDAGGSHDPQDLYRMLDLAEEGFDVVIGSRFCVGGQHLGTWQRRCTSRVASAALNFISLGEVTDWTSGYRVYSPTARAVLERYDFTTTGHAWQIESLAVLRQSGCRIVETPITYRPSSSHLSGRRVREALALWWRLAWK